VFGYYFEISSIQLAKLTSALPPDFVRKQTLANAERFITPELKQFEDKVLGAEEKIKGLEYELFCRLRQSVINVIDRLQAQARRIAVIDAVLSLALYARENKTVRPRLTDADDRPLLIRAGRHPLVEKNIPAGSFVPNDLMMETARFFMITGPNMAGKSTVIRQTGVIVLLAQIGSFVPADEATIGIVDRIFTRVGASDRLARGESTFMVEMCETALILNHATDRSLVLLDEIGRGTSTFDGISIAWAVAEYIHDKIRARTLFATHYHELIDLALTRPGIKNYNVGVLEDGGDVVFLYRLQPGGMSHSYGIHVAKLAGLPATVVERAKEVLKNLESNELEPGGTPRLAKKSKKQNGQGFLF
jgi:DNA mismatch repair protein MutS